MLRVTTLVINKPHHLNKKLIVSLSSDDGDRFRFDITATVQEHHAFLYFLLLLLHDYDTKVKHCVLRVAASGVASHANVFKGARFSSLPTKACSTENNIPFPLFYLRGK